jgi:hypothetical protein
MAAAAARMPYPGLRSFRREESDLLFGREGCIHTMVDRLAATRFLAVLGSSGTGKSSLVKTGLLDALDLGLMAQAGSTWRVVDFRPGGAPLTNLTRRLLQTETAAPADNPAKADVDLLRAFLARGPRSLVEWCGEGHLPERTNLLLLVDQFEELFRYQTYAGREEAEAFAALLLESASSPQVPVYVTLTMRSEYLGACALIDGLAEAISVGMYLIPRMTREQCRAAIVGPAEVCGVEIRQELTNRLLNDLATFAPWEGNGTSDQLTRLVRRADQLPLLQYCLNRMWIEARERAHGAPIVLELADYERIGGLGGALDAHAGEILATFPAERRPVIESVFRALTEGSTVADAVRRPTRFGELVSICGGDEAAVRAVVDAFRAPGCNFLAPELDPDNPQPVEADTFIDITHESLIRQWRTLSGWLEKEAQSVRRWQRLKDRFADGDPMRGVELATMRAWRDEEKPNAAWARRYSGDFPAVMEFLENSEWQQKKWAPLVLPAVLLVLVGVLLVFIAGIFSMLGYSEIPNSIEPIFSGGSIAFTCAFGLWRYTGIGALGAALAGLLGFVLASGGVFLLPEDVTSIWEPWMLAAGVMIGLAAFARPFRQVFLWLFFVVLLAAPISFTNWWWRPPKSGFLALGILFLWLAVLGYYLRGTRRDGSLAQMLHWLRLRLVRGPKDADAAR